MSQRPLIFIETQDDLTGQDREDFVDQLHLISTDYGIVLLPPGCRAVPAQGYCISESLAEYSYTIIAETKAEVLELREAMKGKKDKEPAALTFTGNTGPQEKAPEITLARNLRRKLLIITDASLHDKWLNEPTACLREAGFPDPTRIVRASIHQDFQAEHLWLLIENPNFPLIGDAGVEKIYLPPRRGREFI